MALVLDNIRSAHNVGAILRTCEGLGIDMVYLCGITPYPKSVNDQRLPHVAEKITRRIDKTALGAFNSQEWSYYTNSTKVIEDLNKQGYLTIALEQTSDSVDLTSIKPTKSVALVVGHEIDGVSQEALQSCQLKAEITMAGKKESFNVAAAAAMALFYFKKVI